jgi:S1-C subfamily serine protease
VKFNGHALDGPQDLRNRVADTPVNTAVQLGIIRDNKETTLSADIVEQPADFDSMRQEAPAPTAPPQPPAPQSGGVENNLSGVTVAEIPANQRPELPGNVKGVVVTGVDPDSVAAQAPDPLRAGDVIEEIDRQPVASVADFDRIVRELKTDEKQTLLFICRGKTRSFVVMGQR